MENNNQYLNNLFGLSDKIVVLTGGMGKLGTEFTRALVQAGANVAIFDVIQEPNEELVGLAKEFPLLFFTVDITDENSVLKNFNEVTAKWDTPNVLINNAAWNPSPDKPSTASVPFENYPVQTIDLNITGAAICAKVFAGGLIKEGKPGVVVNIASTYGLVAPDQSLYDHKQTSNKQPYIKDASYSVSKSALIALTRNLAVEWAPRGIRVVALSPGGVITQNGDQEFTRKYEKRTPLGRMANKDEYNGALIFLISDAASYMTGTNLIVDGGWTIW